MELTWSVVSTYITQVDSLLNSPWSVVSGQYLHNTGRQSVELTWSVVSGQYLHNTGRQSVELIWSVELISGQYLHNTGRQSVELT